eukprot:CAMPEP_0198288578 /NCGR_PEP_ID=MMETSP1449-20131203/7030_1 /TAXON_ID=420275 /ORGANISM="Attheya septentrionalis, Strain CCMP2084" /LENGTH=77 /DNA_ID=CAMNT_0043986743 /DNA_START=453 /DNA_END=686 /DNA_ORIENTATION=-
MSRLLQNKDKMGDQMEAAVFMIIVLVLTLYTVFQIVKVLRSGQEDAKEDAANFPADASALDADGGTMPPKMEEVSVQ